MATKKTMNDTLIPYTSASGVKTLIPPSKQTLNNIPEIIISPTNNIIEDQYMALDNEYKIIVDSVTLGIPYEQIYDEYFHEHIHRIHMRDKTLRTTDETDIQPKFKRKLILKLIHDKDLLKFIQHKRKQIEKIYLEEFQKKALSTYVSVEFLANELLKLKEKTEFIDDPKEQVRMQLEVIKTLDKVIKKPDGKQPTTNIQINNNMPDYDTTEHIDIIE
jgi:hypothetical protein